MMEPCLRIYCSDGVAGLDDEVKIELMGAAVIDRRTCVYAWYLSSPHGRVTLDALPFCFAAKRN